LAAWIVFCLAGLAFFAPLKFGTPVIAHPHCSAKHIAEWIFFTWPQQLATLRIRAFMAGARRRSDWPHGWIFCLCCHYVSGFVKSCGTALDRAKTTADTLMAFAVNTLLFYAAAWYVRDGATAARIFGATGVGHGDSEVMALEQRYGGLQRSREYAALYTDKAQTAPDMLLRMTSDRVFASLVYPNALAVTSC